VAYEVAPVSASTAIGLVSSSLRSLLVGEMRLSLAVDVTLLAPDEQAGDRRINLFLYRLAENPYLKNLGPVVLPSDPRRVVPSPLSLDLYYLVTSYAPNDPQDGNATAHQMLGEAMRVLHENPVLPAAYLANGLRDAREQLQIVEKPLDPDELSRIWATFSQPFRLSVLYQVSAVQLDQAPERQSPVPERVRTVGAPLVRRPPDRPAVLSIVPRSVAAGGTVTVAGEHLAGRQAMITIGNRTVLDGARLGADEVAVPVPADLPPGFYELRLGITDMTAFEVVMEVTS
jgi:hypothetical protein